MVLLLVIVNINDQPNNKLFKKKSKELHIVKFEFYDTRICEIKITESVNITKIISLHRLCRKTALCENNFVIANIFKNIQSNL